MQNNGGIRKFDIFYFFSLPFFLERGKGIEASIWTIGIPDFALWIFISNFFIDLDCYV